MAISRYALGEKIRDGKAIATSTNMSVIFNAVESGSIKCEAYVLEESQRLDQLAGLAYQKSSYWWVIAAASGIGWALQVPPGTLIRIPTSLADVLSVLS